MIRFDQSETKGGKTMRIEDVKKLQDVVAVLRGSGKSLERILADMVEEVLDEQNSDTPQPQIDVAEVKRCFSALASVARTLDIVYNTQGTDELASAYQSLEKALRPILSSEDLSPSSPIPPA
ncbi:hypothetical protein COS66_00380 [Candidatus Berkelbacteria bacterium CG06_land_8_20_14_3_00_43_10]|nr:MAG: hypothetical protein COS66_00380 [Candidatus Berkelbacteria bacterium CG06_land_8_20_14_3_00_43_10]